MAQVTFKKDIRVFQLSFLGPLHTPSMGKTDLWIKVGDTVDLGKEVWNFEYDHTEKKFRHFHMNGENYYLLQEEVERFRAPSGIFRIK